jgi:hypothetical protein
MGHVEGDRDGGGAADQGPGIPGRAPALAAQIPPEDDQAGRGGEAVDQQGADQANAGGKAAVSIAKARMASKLTT